jgi:hypothetical protein
MVSLNDKHSYLDIFEPTLNSIRFLPPFLVKI